MCCMLCVAQLLFVLYFAVHVDHLFFDRLFLFLESEAEIEVHSCNILQWIVVFLHKNLLPAAHCYSGTGIAVPDRLTEVRSAQPGGLGRVSCLQRRKEGTTKQKVCVCMTMVINFLRLYSSNCFLSLSWTKS